MTGAPAVSATIVTLPTAAVAPVAPAAPAAVVPLPFGPEFESKAAALVLRDDRFSRETLAYLKPSHFNDAVERNLVLLVQEFVGKYGALPDISTLVSIIRSHPSITPVEQPIYGTKVLGLFKLDLREREYIRSRIVDFCKRQEALRLAADMPDLLGDGVKKQADWEKIKERQGFISQIGESAAAEFNDYFAQAKQREEQRDAKASGVLKTGISTGIPELDKCLYHGGWGRKELTVPMAPAKRGKTAFALQTTVMSCMTAGTKALFVSCEVGLDIVGDRLDACLTGTRMDRLIDDRSLVTPQIDAMGKGPGKLWMERYPANTLTTDGIEALVQYYFDTGRQIDLLVVDYIGILKLKTKAEDRFVGLGLAAKEIRRIAGKFNLAAVVPAQTNRDAVSKATSGMDSIGESFAIVQDCDLLLSINANDQEMAHGVRRIHLAASRNSPEFTIKVRGDMAKMRMIEDVLEVTY